MYAPRYNVKLSHKSVADIKSSWLRAQQLGLLAITFGAIGTSQCASAAAAASAASAAAANLGEHVSITDRLKASYADIRLIVAQF